MLELRRAEAVRATGDTNDDKADNRDGLTAPEAGGKGGNTALPSPVSTGSGSKGLFSIPIGIPLAVIEI
jgi:hypothetical protein